jgi:ADP-heptose:LPS heptosyltransferase
VHNDSSISMHALQRADKLLGPLACVALQVLRVTRLFKRERPIERVLLIKFWGVGSLQLLTPAVRALRRRHPGASITLLTLSQNGEFARGLRVFDDVLLLDVSGPGWIRVFSDILRRVLSVRGRHYDAVYDFEFFTRFSAVVAVLTGAPSICGFAASSVWRGHFQTRSVPFNRYWHVARNFRCLAGGENGVEIAATDLSALVPSPEHEAELDRAITRAELVRVGPLVLLNPNAGSLSLERRWPQSYFADLARVLVHEHGARVALIGSLSERAWTAEVAALAGELPKGSLVNLAGELSLGALHALFARAAVCVSNDSGPMHLAAASGTPTLGLFGPETPVMYGPIGPRAKALYRPPACSPCINVHENKVVSCFRGRPECLLAISVDEVRDEVIAIMRREDLHMVDVPRYFPRVDAPAVNGVQRVLDERGAPERAVPTGAASADTALADERSATVRREIAR